MVLSVIRNSFSDEIIKVFFLLFEFEAIVSFDTPYS